MCYSGDKDELCDAMLHMGFDATATATQLGSIDQFMTDFASQQKDLVPHVMKSMFAKVVYLPVTAEMPMWCVKKMADAFIETVREVEGGEEDDDVWDDDDDGDFDDEDWNDEEDVEAVHVPRSKL